MLIFSWKYFLIVRILHTLYVSIVALRSIFNNYQNEATTFKYLHSENKTEISEKVCFSSRQAPIYAYGDGSIVVNDDTIERSS